MLLRRFLHLSLAASLLASNLARAAAQIATNQTPATPTAQAQTPADPAARLAAVEKVFEEKRKELGIPGASFAVVRDDRVVLLKASGMKDAAKSLPATPDTLFAIGSCTKAMTALAAVMSQDDGRLSLDDSPKKFLPYFRLSDPEADAGATLRDLLSHRTGLGGTDLSWYMGGLSREEVIRVAGGAKPTAKLREKFQYQNVMYSAAGEAVGRAQGKTWEAVVAERILRPLGMKTSTLTVAEMQRSPDYSLGYEIDAKTKAARHVPTRDLTNIAPAGAVNSSAREMAEWVRLMLAGGAHGGRRLVSEKGFAELFTPQIKADANNSYALGWGVRQMGAHRAVLHSGGIDGFNSYVVLFPDARTGFVLLTNVGSSSLGASVIRAVIEHLIEQPKPAANAQASGPRPQDEAGRYDFTAAKMIITVTHENGKLYADVPGQQRYTLELVEGRRYRLAELEGFYLTFRPVKGVAAETEAYLEQPQGNYTLPRLKPVAASPPSPSASAAPYDGPLKELVGAYRHAAGGKAEVTIRDGKVVLSMPGQPDYPLVEKEKDVLQTPLLPDSYSIHVRRDAAGKVSALLIKQPEGEFDYKRAADAPATPAATPTTPAQAAPPITAEELLTKMIAAAGGEANWRAHRSLTMRVGLEFPNQGMAGEAVILSQAPNSFARELTFKALGRPIGVTREYFDGTTGGEEQSFTAAPVAWDARKLEEMRASADFYALVNWKTLYKSVAVREMSKVNGEDAYVLVLTPHKGEPIVEYVSAKTFLTLRRDATELPASGEGGVPTSITFADYREVGGVRLPFLLTYTLPEIGEVTSVVREAKFDAPIPATAFRAKTK